MPSLASHSYLHREKRLDKEEQGFLSDFLHLLGPYAFQPLQPSLYSHTNCTKSEP